MTFFIVLMLLVSSLLLMVGNNLPVFASYRWLWGPVFLLFVLIVNPELYTSKQMLNVLAFGILYCGLLQYTLWSNANDWYIKSIVEDFYAMIVVVLLFVYLKKNNYYGIFIKLARIAFVFFVMTGITTIIASSIEPEIVRASYSSGKELISNYDLLSRLGFGSYGYMTALIALLPTLVYFYKKKHTSHGEKWFIILSILFFLFVLVKAQIFANILMAIVILLISILGASKLKKSITIFTLVCMLCISIPVRYYADLLINLSGFFETGSQNYYKLNDMATFILNPEVSTSTEAGERVARYPDLWRTFKSQPFFGDASYVSGYYKEMALGGHLYWMSHLALWGILGFCGYLMILRNIFKPVFEIFDSDFKFYYSLSIIAVIGMGFMKNLGGREIWLMLLLIIPGLYFSQCSHVVTIGHAKLEEKV